eukprot:gnl/MRDRNA2_/MRDRNA2_70786_c0_seq1.p1 gnl/MRDRNA2_/MRDRNA2_70786_c0~~gnl/MRDRNA2_/MRDRNA2_70786_c0_seq1.p1  ORF type:complete len:517 (+),score=123.79 gnl/MRDRNA2_/MRDRNA2_70786_c0_seq1:79-1551(+)
MPPFAVSYTAPDSDSEVAKCGRLLDARVHIQEKPASICFLFTSVGKQHLARGLSFLSLRQVIALRQCHPCLRALIDGSEDAIVSAIVWEAGAKSWMSYLLQASGFPRPPCFFVQVAEQLCKWASVTVLNIEEECCSVEEWSSNGLTLSEFKDSHPDSEVSLMEVAHHANLSAELCSAFAERCVASASFTCSDQISQKILALAKNLRSNATWEQCNYSKSHSNSMVDDGSGGGNDKERYQVGVRITTPGGAVRLTFQAEYFSFVDLADGVEDEESEIKCMCVLPGSDARRELFTVKDTMEEYNRSVEANAEVVGQMSSVLLGEQVEHAVTLHLLWRLLCAQTVAWPRWTPKTDLRYECSRVGAELIDDEVPCDRHCYPAFHRFRSIFEKVAAKLTPQGGIVAVSSSPLDDETFLDLFWGLAGKHFKGEQPKWMEENEEEAETDDEHDEESEEDFEDEQPEQMEEASEIDDGHDEENEESEEDFQDSDAENN